MRNNSNNERERERERASKSKRGERRRPEKSGFWAEVSKSGKIRKQLFG
jgi:hypothetical protein